MHVCGGTTGSLIKLSSDCVDNLSSVPLCCNLSNSKSEARYLSVAGFCPQGHLCKAGLLRVPTDGKVQVSLLSAFVQVQWPQNSPPLTEDRLIYFSNKQNPLMQSAITLRIIGAGLVALRASSADLSIKSCRRAFDAVIGNGVSSD